MNNDFTAIYSGVLCLCTNLYWNSHSCASFKIHKYFGLERNKRMIFDLSVTRE